MLIYINLIFQLIEKKIKMRLGIYVGSFNPVHNGHISIVNYLIKNKYVDKIEIIPTGNYWDKNNLISINDRINMLKFYENDNIIINSTLNNLEYTYQILREFNDEIYLIVGADILPKFYLWKNIDEILENKIIVINRNDIDVNRYIEEFNNKDNFIVINDLKTIDISSTKIRELVKDDKKKELKKLLDINVVNYIYQNNLYR